MISDGFEELEIVADLEIETELENVADLVVETGGRQSQRRSYDR